MGLVASFPAVASFLAALVLVASFPAAFLLVASFPAASFLVASFLVALVLVALGQRVSDQVEPSLVLAQGLVEVLEMISQVPQL